MRENPWWTAFNYDQSGGIHRGLDHYHQGTPSAKSLRASSLLQLENCNGGNRSQDTEHVQESLVARPIIDDDRDQGSKQPATVGLGPFQPHHRLLSILKLIQLGVIEGSRDRKCD